jgi:hypothetical protein
MKKSVKTESVVLVFNIIKDAKYSKMSDFDKLVIFKIFKAIKAIAETFNNEVNDAKQKLVPYDEFFQDLVKAQAYEIARSKSEEYSEMTEEEYNEFIQKFVKYNKLVEEATKESAEKEVEIEFVPLTKEAFEKLVLSNNWTFTQTDEVEAFVCE